jgi:hypothetical protein
MDGVCIAIPGYEFGGDEQLFPVDIGTHDRVTDCFLAIIHLCSIDMSISGLQCHGDGTILFVVLEGLENLTGEPHRTTTVNGCLVTLTDEYGLVKRHESPNEDDDWRPSEKERRFADLMIDDEFLANLQAIWEEIDE